MLLSLETSVFRDLDGALGNAFGEPAASFPDLGMNFDMAAGAPAPRLTATSLFNIGNVAPSSPNL